MALRLITAEERLSEARRKRTVAVFGPHSIGKTRLVLGLDQSRTMFVEMDAGMSSIEDYNGGHARPETWIDLAEIGCLMAGPDPTAQPSELMSELHYAEVIKKSGKRIDLSPFNTLFLDSITVMARWCGAWAKGRPESYDRYGNFNSWGYYGLIAKEMIRTLTHFQRAPGLNVVYVGILESKKDAQGIQRFQMQLEGDKTREELPGIMDVVITMDVFTEDPVTGAVTHAHSNPEGHIGFMCHQRNPFGLPGKDRLGLLDMMEPPDLGKLFDKLNPQKKKSPTVIALKASAESKS